MAIPSINDLVTYVNTALTGLNFNANFQQVVNWFTDGTADITINSITVNGRIKDKTGYVMPVSAMMPYAGATAPDGFLICDNSEISRTTYEDLFNIIGTTYGVGDGSTTFNLPDMRETVPIGIGTRGSGVAGHDVYTLGQFKDDQLQGHWHIVTDQGYYGNTSNAAGADPTQLAKGNGTPSGTFALSSMSNDFVHGTPRSGTTTHGKQLGLNYIIKY